MDRIIRALSFHEVTPHSRMLAIVLFLAVVPGLSFYLGMEYNETVRIVNEDALMVTLVPVDPNAAKETPKQNEYTGAWFSVRYPSDFVPKMIGTTTARNLSDEAEFTSPDGAVTFYVYSPQWAGEPDSLLPREGEMLIDENEQASISDVDGYPKRTTHWVTYGAKDGSYTRALVSIQEGFSDEEAKGGDWAVFHRVFGITYKDQESYDRYRNEYLAFKASLVQYAD